jgi:hypothetical protein
MKILHEPTINPIHAEEQSVNANKAQDPRRMSSWVAILAVWSAGLAVWLAIVAVLLAQAE